MRRMQSDGQVETYLVESQSGPPRKYYRLTKQGKQTSKKKIDELREFIETLQILLDANKGTSHGLIN